MTVSQSLPLAARILTANLRELHDIVVCGISEQHVGRSRRAVAPLVSPGQHTQQLGTDVRPISELPHNISAASQLVCDGYNVRRQVWQVRQHIGQLVQTRLAPSGSKRLVSAQLQLAAGYSSTAVPRLQEHPKPHSGWHSLQQSHTKSSRAWVLDGKGVAAEWSAELEQQVPVLTAALGRPPGLAVVLVGNRPDSMLYVSRKQEACQQLGIKCQVMHLPDTISQAKLQDAVAQVAADQAVDGVLVQLPLPRHLDEERVMEFLDPRKDVDGFHPLNMGRMLMRGRARRFVPATPLGVVELLSRTAVSVAGKTAVVLGDSNIVGTPLAALLRDEGAALVTTCHRVSYQEWYDQAVSRTRRAQAEVCLPRLPGPTPAAEKQRQQSDSRAAGSHSSRGDAAGSKFQASQLPNICRTADILIVAVGSPELVKGDWVKPGAIVVDVGINVVPLAAPTSSTTPLCQQQLQQSPDHVRVGSSVSHCCQPHTRFQLAQGSLSESECRETATQNGGLEDNAMGSSYGLCSGSYRVVGDVAHDEVADVASVLTPVPGGVGPMTIAAVLHNTMQAARYTAGILPW